jgi:transcriptional regulator of met regulon
MKRAETGPNASYVDKASFRKVTVTLPQGIYERLIKESARRKIEGVPNQMVSDVFREALSAYLDRMD